MVELCWEGTGRDIQGKELGEGVKVREMLVFQQKDNLTLSKRYN
jgi:hypothetical protein